jgi:hypothetical protein
VELALEVGVGESGASVSTWLPRVFSRAKIWAHSPGSYPDRFDLFGQEWSRHQMSGVGMPTIRQHSGRIHGKIGTHSRLAIGLWAVREGMVKSAIQPESAARIPGPYKGCPA